MAEELAFSFSSEPTAETAATALSKAIEARLGGPQQVAGACLMATAASGGQAREIGEALSSFWPRAELLGTSFEALIAGGQSWRDQPAFILMAWRETPNAPLPLLVEKEEPNLGRVAEAILDAFPGAPRSAADLLLLFPDAMASPAIEPQIPSLLERIGPLSLAGAAASGPAGEPAAAWALGEDSPGSCVGLLLPGWGRPGASDPRSVVGVAAGSRSASGWLEITRSRSRWIDELSGQRALPALREALGLSRRDSIERHLDRLLVRVRGRRFGQAGDDGPRFEERYIVGLDKKRGSLSLPIEIEQGGQISLAWPDADQAREALRETFDRLPRAPIHLQFACRARDAALHGDEDLESAWVASRPHSGEVFGTIGPFQLAAGGGPSQIDAASHRLVHSTVLVSIRAEEWKEEES